MSSQEKHEINYLVNSFYFKNKTAKIPKSLLSFFTVLQMCFGIDAGFSDIFGEKKKKIMTIISSLLSLVISSTLLAPAMFWYDKIWMWCTFVKYIMDFFTLKFTKYKMYDFVKDIHYLSENISGINGNLFGAVILGYTLIMFILKSCLVTLRCIIGHSRYCYRVNFFYYIWLNYCCLTADAISSILIVIMFYCYSSVRHMKNCLDKTLDLKDFENRYIAIAKCFKVRQLFNGIITIELFTNTPRLMVTLWCMLVYIKNNADWYSYTTEWLVAFHLAIQMCIPAVIAEMVNSEIDSIKLILNEQRRVEKDRVKSEEITRLLRYIKVRRLQNDIWRVIPIDSRLPLALISLCTTYFIVILQFTHLYD